jgi:hypothetical protein
VWGRLVLLLLAGSVLGLAGCQSGSPSDGNESPQAGPTRVTDLENVLQLRAAFNEDRGTPRLLLLLSPT